MARLVGVSNELLNYQYGLYPNKLVPERINTFSPGIITPAGIKYQPNIPTIPAYTKLDVNSDPELRNNIVKYFKHKVLKWLKIDEDYKRILNYFVIRADSKKNEYVDIVRDIKEYEKENKDTNDIIKMKIQFIRKYVLRKKLIARILEKYGNKYNVKWWHFKSNKDIIKDIILHELKKKIKNNIREE
jgi:hypothetical protein